MVGYDSRHGQVRLGREIGGGGEASIHEVIGQPDLLAKIYNGLPRPGYDQKLAWLLANPPNNPTHTLGHASIAWPLELLYSSQGQFVGYLMPYIHNAVSLLNVFNPRRQAQTLPGFNWKYLHRTAHNLAAVLGALHARGYVVGDLSESNVMVTPSALVTIIDADSFQVQEQIGARLVIYPCPVGKPEYTPPELQGRSFQGTQRLPEHDCFSLGVLIFQLLMEGSHPFRARWLGRGDAPPIEERIRQGCFPYVKSSACQVAAPRTLSLDMLHPRLADLARRCFVDGHHDPRQRPAPGEWERAIAESENALVTCHNGHYFSNHRLNCHRCGARRKGAQLPVRRPRPVAPAPVPKAIPQPVTPSPVPPVPATAACSNCGALNAPTLLYCQGCESPLQLRVCIYCGYRALPGSAARCPKCGKVV